MDAIVSFFIGFVIGILCMYLIGRRKHGKGLPTIKGITEFIYVVTMIAAIIWVSMSYVIAMYGTYHFGQVFPVETLSGQALIAILGVCISKTISNIFEHNDGVVWGESRNPNDGPED